MGDAQGASRAPEPGRAGPPPDSRIDIERLADKVDRLMREELRQLRARGQQARPGRGKP